MNIKFNLFLINVEQQFYMYGKSDIIVARTRGHAARESLTGYTTSAT
jgi:hypothetical protein